MRYHLQAMDPSNGFVEFDEVYNTQEMALLHVEDQLNRGRQVSVHPTTTCYDTTCDRDAEE